MPAYRDSITPMDFEYDNNTGPIDPQSPFAQFHAAKKRKLDSFASRPTSAAPGQQLNEPTGTHSVFESPSKSSFATPNHPKLSDPNNQRFLFSQTKPLPQTPQAQNNKVWELRTPQSVVDSSGGETPTTPAQDSDAATPDTQLAITMGGLSHGEKKSPPEARQFLQTPTLGFEPIKREGKGPQGEAIFEESRESHNESSSKPLSAPQVAPAIGFAAKIPGVLAWVEAHPNLPNVLSYYMQFIVNAVLGLFCLWIVYVVYSAVMADISIEASNKAQDIMHEIAVCAQDVRKRDAYKVARASVGARTFAMIFNSFVEEFSYKSMVFALLFIFLCHKAVKISAAIVDYTYKLQEVAAVRAQQQADVLVPVQQQHSDNSNRTLQERTSFANNAMYE
ncbi:hypothetical protein N0V90_000852 [Kalmusia sp. IMI 367209]|nr:hypothetical protein N0V90_000852 [Kalmusia sp. IMI 367209]